MPLPFHFMMGSRVHNELEKKQHCELRNQSPWP